ncbi:MAG: hypothetical protein WC028_01815 [Candidatus Obscuribacterales bacterium]
MKALEVLIDGISVGVFVPSLGDTFAFSLCNGPQEDSIVARVVSGSPSEWCLPTVRYGQRISFRMIDSPAHDGPQPQIIQPEIV